MSEIQAKAERLASCAGVSVELALSALKETGGDLLEAALLLERRGSAAPCADGFYTTRPQGVCVRPAPSAGAGGEGEPWKARVRALLRALLDILRHCTVNQLEIWRKGELLTAVPVVILILLLVVAFWVTAPLLVIGLALGCRYRFAGPELDVEKINRMLDSAASCLRQAAVRLKDEAENWRRKKR